MIDFSRNHFDLFGLPVRFRLDPVQLDGAFRRLQSEVHPDRHAAGGDADKRLALQASAQVNAAYGTLKDPVSRAEYLLALHGIDARDETDTRLPLDFLERQLERREEADDAAAQRDLRTLSAIQQQVREESAELEAVLATLLDGDDRSAARERVRELRFLSKVAEDLRALEARVDEAVED